MSTEIPPMSLEEGVSVRKEGGVQEVKVADIKVQRRTDYDEQLKRELDAERAAAEKAKQARDEAQAHRKLMEEAEQLKAKKLQQSSQEEKDVARMVEQVEKLKIDEIDAEKKRADIHRQAVAAEDDRVKALAAKVLHQEEAREAAKLAAQHAEGIKYSENLAKQYDFEIQEAQLRQKRISAMSEQTIVGHPIPLTNEAARIHVDVQPQGLPEQREFGASVPSGDRRQATMKEKLPEEFAQRAAEIDTASALNKTATTKVEVKKETKQADKQEQAHGIGPADIVGAVMNALTGQKQ